MRKHVVQYDDVMNKQREVIYADRRKIIAGEELKDRILEMVAEEVVDVVARHWSEDSRVEPDYAALLQEAGQLFPHELTPAQVSSLTREELEARLVELSEEAYERKEAQLGAETMRQVERLVWLGVIDRLWIEHLTAMDEMRQGIGLQAYGQRDPLIAYKTEGFRMFQSLLANIRHDLTHQIYWVEIVRPLRPRAMEEAVTNRDEDGEDGRKRPKKRTAQKVGRNDPCPCGSGKKYKNCHGATTGAPGGAGGARGRA